MSKSELWVRADRHTDKQTDTHNNTITRPGLGAGPSKYLSWHCGSCPAQAEGQEKGEGQHSGAAGAGAGAGGRASRV